MAPSTAAEQPAVTVVIPTRDRGDRIARAVSGLLSIDYPRFSLHIVDQSADDRTEKVASHFDRDPRVHYERITSTGISAALNRGISLAGSEVVAITGDDCEPESDWLKMLVAPFSLDSRIAIVFGNVLVGPHDDTLGFVPGYVRTGVAHARGIRDKHLIGGTTACMALRRSVWKELSGFDEMLGVGAPMSAGEDVDMTIRALLSGHHVYETPAAAVVHRGFFPWEERATVIRRNWYGTGAAFAKSLRQGHPSVLYSLVRLALRWAAVGPSPVASSLGRTVPSRSILRAFAGGFWTGALRPLDPTSGHYRRLSG